MSGKRQAGEGKRGRNMEWVVQFESQMVVCGLLAKALYGPPDRAWLDMLVRERVFDTDPFGTGLPEIGSALQSLRNWSETISGDLDDAAFGLVVDDYNRLFVGPTRLLAAPWESVYTNKDRAVFQMESVSVKNWYQRFDLALASTYNEPADHIGLQFSFLAHLCERTIAASEKRDGQEVKRLIDAQRGFLGQHMLKWVHRWADDVLRHAKTDLYRGLAWLARGTALDAGSFLAAESVKAAQSGPFRIEKPSRY